MKWVSFLPLFVVEVRVVEGLVVGGVGEEFVVFFFLLFLFFLRAFAVEHQHEEK